jgi:vancomycin resistance protein YoaR
VYISRYPPGREATLNWGTIDNRWRNDTDHPIVVRASTTSTSVTVSLYGHTGKRVVRSVTGSQQYRPGGGFRIAVTRTITDDGERTGKDTLTWTYKPPL